MATKKPKTSTKSTKTKSAKTGTTEKSVKKPEIEAPKTKTVEMNKTSEKKHWLSGFFAKKYEENESILTVFKNRKFYGALLGEVIGTMLITLLLLMFASPDISIFATVTYAPFALIAVLITVYAFSGACLNPLIAVGMIASRRVSVIRGIMYIVAEVVGAWFGWLILSGFHLAGGETASEMATMAPIAEDGFWMVALVELLGASIIGFFFARAIEYKRSVFTFSITVVGGIILAIIAGYIISSLYLRLSNNFIMNPAIALTMKIFPESSSSFGEALGGILQALSAYAIIPMVGGIIGFYLSDFTKKLSED